jgi:hypothetical protein
MARSGSAHKVAQPRPQIVVKASSLTHHCWLHELLRSGSSAMQTPNSPIMLHQPQRRGMSTALSLRACPADFTSIVTAHGARNFGRFSAHGHGQWGGHGRLP